MEGVRPLLLSSDAAKAMQCDARQGRISKSRTGRKVAIANINDNV